MKAMILCAGEGMRLRPLTENIPKPMIPIAGIPVLEYLLLLCKKHGITEIAINTSYLPKMITGYFGAGKKWGISLRYSFEPTLLGTAGALNNFRDFFTERFFVIYGDNITNLDLGAMLEFHKRKKSVCTVYGYVQTVADEKTTPGCILTDSSSRITHFMERPTEEEKKIIERVPPQDRVTNSGIYILEKEMLDLIPPSGVSDFSSHTFPLALAKNIPLFVYREDCYIREVGQLMRYELAKKEIESGRVVLDFIPRRRQPV